MINNCPKATEPGLGRCGVWTWVLRQGVCAEPVHGRLRRHRERGLRTGRLEQIS